MRHSSVLFARTGKIQETDPLSYLTVSELLVPTNRTKGVCLLNNISYPAGDLVYRLSSAGCLTLAMAMISGEMSNFRE